MKKKRSFYQSKYRALRFRLGYANKAKVAIANRLARTVFKILAGDEYKELGYHRGQKKNEKKIENLLSQLKNCKSSSKHTFKKQGKGPIILA